MKRAYNKIIKLSGELDSAINNLRLKVLDKLDNDLGIDLSLVTINQFADGGMALMFDMHADSYEAYNNSPPTGVRIETVMYLIQSSKEKVKFSELIKLRTE